MTSYSPYSKTYPNGVVINSLDYMKDMLAAFWISRKVLLSKHIEEVKVSGGEYLGTLSKDGTYLILG
jgi:hypothetical protein